MALPFILCCRPHLPFLCPHHFPRIRDMNNAIKDDNEIRFSFIKKKRFSWLITWSSHPSYWSTIRWRWQRPRQVFTLFQSTSKKSHCEPRNWNLYLVWNIFHDFKNNVKLRQFWRGVIWFFCSNSVRRFRRCMYTRGGTSFYPSSTRARPSRFFRAFWVFELDILKSSLGSTWPELDRKPAGTRGYPKVMFYKANRTFI